jgi:hypothetical protein
MSVLNVYLAGTVIQSKYYFINLSIMVPYLPAPDPIFIKFMLVSSHDYLDGWKLMSYTVILLSLLLFSSLKNIKV